MLSIRTQSLQFPPLFLLQKCVSAHFVGVLTKSDTVVVPYNSAASGFICFMKKYDDIFSAWHKKKLIQKSLNAPSPRFIRILRGEARPRFTRCMLCIEWPNLKGSARCVLSKNKHRGHIKRLFNPIIQQAAVQKADAGKNTGLSLVANSLPSRSSLLSPLSHTSHCVHPLRSKIPKKPTFVSNPPFFIFILKHWLWQSSSANTHCFSDMSAAALNHVIARTIQSTKPLLSAAWALSDICHFRFTRALCQPYTDAAFSSNNVEKNAPPQDREPSHNLENINQMLGATRRYFQFKQETSSGAAADLLKYESVQRGPVITSGC